ILGYLPLRKANVALCPHHADRILGRGLSMMRKLRRTAEVWGFAAASVLAGASTALAEPARSPLDAADTAWMISATGLVLMMSIPGLALFYSGMVRKKNVLATMAQTLMSVAIGSLLWALVCYSLAFSGEGSFLGTLDRALLRG